MSALPSLVTPLIKQAIHLNHYAFGYLYPAKISLGINEKNTIVLKNRPLNWKLIPWLIVVVIFTFGFAFCPCFYLIVSQLLGRPPKLQVHIYFLTIAFGIGIIVEFILYWVIHKYPELFETINAFFRLEQQFCNANIQTTATTKTSYHSVDDDRIGLFLIVIIVSFAFGGPLAVPLGLYIRADPFYYIFEELLPHPYFRERFLICLIPLIRFLLGFLCLMEFLRLGVFALLGIFIVGFVFISLTHNLHKIQRSTKRPHSYCYTFYTQLRILFVTIQEFIQTGASLAVFLGHVGTIMAFWFVITCVKYVPFLVSIMAVGVAGYLLLFTLLLLPAVAFVGETTWALVTQKRSLYYITPGKQCLFWRKNLRYYLYLIWSAQKGISLECGRFFVFHGDTTIAYLTHLVNNLTTAIIVIHP